MRILHLSDLHFGPPYVPEIGEAFLQLAPTLQPDVIVVSGDLTQRAKRGQFLRARDFLDRLPDRPTLVIPGNHDIPLYRVKERWCDPLGLYKEIISPDLNPVLRLGQAVLVGIDSTAPHRAISNGRIGIKQLEHCRKVFADTPPEAARMIVAHHHFAPAPDYLHDQTMPKAKRAINQFVELGVEMILGGHLHRAYIGNSLNFYPGHHRDRGIVIVQCGTTTSRRGRGSEREKNSFNVIDFDANLITITHQMYFDDDQQFAPLSRHQFPRLGKRFQSQG
ncbi:cyclic 3',5'-adenosine monophosphate phosphodiesterase [Novipirellula aureliae]|uniref:Cyclic 3',5'-adenosine monophosphate phosphodiesterase n=1 Tax=Novipirellula aureliae TaxID=2527966 RepID=A0A5C6E8E4_9BACT|nr:metallophosphoesterase family protein [Novipirellula aureliae]TWU43489.1 cyclic 3',5'-adenosine monophosphate phosphodiesterase [Novipirellula aureliae]